MDKDQAIPRTIDEYIAGFPPDIQAILEKIRTTIRKAAPQAEEAIGYRMPTFKLYGNLVHFAAYAHHVGFYPTSSGIERFSRELSRFKTSRGTIQFPLDDPIPYELIARITRFRVEENRTRVESKKKKK